MPAAPRSAAAKLSPPSVFLAALDHPLKNEIVELDRAVRAIDEKIQAGVKWNSLSWTTREYFGTVFLRSTASVQVVLHFGAKVKRGARPAIDDPAGLLEWKADDRALATLGNGPEFRRALPAFCAVVRQWIAFV